MSAAPEEPSHSPKHESSSPGSSAASNLYLITFLATLFLLLIFSCGIVMRSYVIRRRIMRRIEEAIANDPLADHRVGAGTRKRRPKFYDRWIVPATNNGWEDIMPLALRVVLGRRAQKSGETKKQGIITWKPTSCAGSLPAPAENPPSPPRFEIIQITVLIEMPSPERSKLYGHLSSDLKSVDDRHDHDVLPELVMGYARCHKH